MISSKNGQPENRAGTKFLWPPVILFGVLLFIFTWFGIQKSRSDSLELLRVQGTALIESLTLSAENAIKANSFFNILAEEKFSDLVSFLAGQKEGPPSSPELADFASDYNIDAVLIFDREMKLLASGSSDVFGNLNQSIGLVLPGVRKLLLDSLAIKSFQIIEGAVFGETVITCLMKNGESGFITAIVSDAHFYDNARKNIGIGYLVQNIAREVGVEYILFQRPDGIIFSSKKIAPLLKIEKDLFLKNALDNSEVFSREIVVADRKIMELVKKFSSDEYGDGLFRIGISMEKYYSIMAGYDRQMIALSAVILIAAVLSVLYLSGKRKRMYLDFSYRQMKSLSDKVFDSIETGLVVIRPDGAIELSNKRLLSIFEITNDDIIGKSVSDIPQLRSLKIDADGSADRGPTDYELEYNSTAGVKHLLINCSRLYDEGKQSFGQVFLIYDYTMIKKLEDDVRRRERLSELGDLAAGVAHEIRNPLNAISIAAQRLLAEFEPTENIEQFQSFAQQIKSEAGRLDDIVTRFLSMARSRQSSGEECEISRVVDEAVEFIRLDVGKHGPKLSVEIEPGLRASVSGDRVRQLVINLVKNAIEACSETKGAGAGQIDVELKRLGDKIILKVADSGKGVPLDIRKKIFNPYFTTKANGTGLGLSIVHQIVSEFEGEGSIEVSSSDTGGAEFIVQIPV